MPSYEPLGADAPPGAALARDYFRRALAAERLAHAYLLVGPRGTGKRAFAADVAMAALCEGPRRPCRACPSCHRIARGSHPAVSVLDPPGRTIDIDSIRSLRDALTLRGPSRRVWIVADCDRMTPQAANALLKTVEEPLGETTILLTTARPGALLPTILSRAQRIPFLRPPGAPRSENAGGAGEPWPAFVALRRPDALEEGEPRELLDVPRGGDLEAVRGAIRLHLARAIEAGRAAISAAYGQPVSGSAGADAGVLGWGGSDPLRIAARLRRLAAAAEDLERNVNPDLVLEALLEVLRAP